MSQAATLSPHRSSRTETIPTPANVGAAPTSLMEFLVARTKVTRIPKRLIDEETTQEGHRFVCVLLFKARQDGIALVSYKEMGQLCGWSRSKVDRVVAQLKPLDLFEHGRFDVNGRKRWGFSINWARLGFTNGPSGSCRGGWTPIPNRLITSTLSDEVYRCMELLIHYRDMANGISHPSILRLTQRLRCCESSVFNYLRVLREESCVSRAEFESGQETCLAFDINWDVVAPVERPTEKVKTVPVLRVKNTPVPGVEPLKSWSDNTPVPGVEPLKSWSDNTPVPGVEPLKSWSDNTPVPGPNIDSEERDPKNTPPSTRTQKDAAEGGERAGVGGGVFLSRDEKAPDPVPEVTPKSETVARTLGGLPIVGRDSQEAKDLEARIEAREPGGVARKARSLCDDAPIEWIEATFRAKIQGNVLEPKRQVGLLGSIIASNVAKGESDHYRPSATMLGGSLKNGTRYESPWDRQKRLDRERDRLKEIERGSSREPLEFARLSEIQLRTYMMYVKAGVQDYYRYGAYKSDPRLAQIGIANEVHRRERIDEEPGLTPQTEAQQQVHDIFAAANLQRLYPYYAFNSPSVANRVVADVLVQSEYAANSGEQLESIDDEPVESLYDDGPREQELTQEQRERDERHKTVQKMFEDAGIGDYYGWYATTDLSVDVAQSLIRNEVWRRKAWASSH